jgi:hypothetical protein
MPVKAIPETGRDFGEFGSTAPPCGEFPVTSLPVAAQTAQGSGGRSGRSGLQIPDRRARPFAFLVVGIRLAAADRSRQANPNPGAEPHPVEKTDPSLDPDEDPLGDHPANGSVDESNSRLEIEDRRLATQELGETW